MIGRKGIELMKTAILHVPGSDLFREKSDKMGWDLQESCRQVEVWAPPLAGVERVEGRERPLAAVQKDAAGGWDREAGPHDC